MATTTNFSLRLQREQGWYDDFEPHNVNLSSLTRKQLTFRRARAWTLHQYPSFSQEFTCGFRFWLPGENTPTEIGSESNAQLNFSISGGVEIPSFILTLRLAYKDRPDQKDNQYLKLTMIWTAWDEIDFEKRGFATAPAFADGPETQHHTFSARLRQASLTAINLTQTEAKLCQGDSGANGYQARWACKVEPYCYGFDIQKSSMQWFNDAQRESIKNFTKAAKADRFRLHTRVYPDTLLENWNTLKSMPSPTFAPYSLYDCRWNHQAKRFERMEQIPNIDDVTIQAHHRRRERGWSHISARGPCFTEPFEIPGFGGNAPITFINEREYQAIRSIGLLREVAALESQYQHQFNREYTFDMIPASEDESTETASSADTYYIALEIQPRVDDGDVEQVLQLPEVGTPVSVIPKGRDPKQSKEPIWAWPESKICQSSSVQQSSSRDRTIVVAMRDKSKASPSSPGPSSPRQIVAQQGKSISKPGGPNPFEQSSSMKTVWQGYVISTSLADIKSLGPPINLVFAKIHKPQGDLTRGPVLNMTARVTFGRSHTPRVAASKALQNVMWGNPGLGITKNTEMKALLLAHENHVMKFLPPDHNLNGTNIPDFLKWLKQSRNTLQKQAIQEALSPRGSFLKLITGPPGTGKTAVSTAIIEYCYVEEKPILVVCGQDEGLDVVARRYSSSYGRSHPGMPGVYRLRTEFVESVDNHFRDGQEVTTTQVHGLRRDFQNAVRELNRPDISDRIIHSLETSLTEMGANLDHLSLGRLIISRVKNEIRSNASQPDKADDDGESEMLREFALWQQVLQRMKDLQVEPIDLASTASNDFSENQRELQEGFQKLWGMLQEFYLKQARVMFCTATTAGRHILRGFRPQIVLIEEASQIPEILCLVPITSSYSSLYRVVLSGDTAQLPLTVLSRNKNECFQAEQLSLFERMILSGHPDTRLQVQYRMMRGICRFVNAEFYNNKLQTVESAQNSATSQMLSDSMVNRYKCSRGSSFFVSVSGSTVLRRRGTASAVNLEYVAHIADLINALARYVKLPQEDILVLSYYNEERRVLTELLQKHGKSKVRVKSVDSAQGSESPVVILSTTRPGGEYGLGFLSDRKRACVALSRARSCLVIVGDEKMGVGLHAGTSQGFLLWQRLVKQHRETSNLCHVQGTSRLVQQHLGISVGHAGYERAVRS